jgi:hypothetical protein
MQINTELVCSVMLGSQRETELLLYQLLFAKGAALPPPRPVSGCVKVDHLLRESDSK